MAAAAAAVLAVRFLLLVCCRGGLRSNADPTPEPPPLRSAVHTPYHVTPGGGEKVLLTVAALLQSATKSGVDLVVYSDNVCQDPACVRSVADQLGVAGLDTSTRDAFDVRVVPAGAEGSLPGLPDYLVWFYMANSLLPVVLPHGVWNVFHSQFPFDLYELSGRDRDRLVRLAGYDAVYVNSNYTMGWYVDGLRRACGGDAALLCSMPVVRHFPPPIQVLPDMGGADAGRGPDIVHVGRIFEERQGKHQLEAIEAFGKLRHEFPGVRLHVLGAYTRAEFDGYLARVRAAAAATPGVDLRVDATREELMAAYKGSLVAWSITGIGRPELEDPADAEHFGLALTEAMSAATVPVVLRKGGPVEIVEGIEGARLVDNVDGLARETAAVLRASAADHDAWRQSAARRARELATFHADFLRFVAGPEPGVGPHPETRAQWVDARRRERERRLAACAP